MNSWLARVGVGIAVVALVACGGSGSDDTESGNGALSGGATSSTGGPAASSSGTPSAPASGAAETGLPKADIIAFQNTLCVDPTGDFGASGSGSASRAALTQFFQAEFFPHFQSATDTIATSAQLRMLRDAVSVIPSCKDAGLANAFEVGVLSTPVDATGTLNPMVQVGMIAAALQAANAGAPDGLDAPTFGPSVADAMHQAIVTLRGVYGMPGPAALDVPLFNKIVRSTAAQ